MAAVGRASTHFRREDPVAASGMAVRQFVGEIERCGARLQENTEKRNRMENRIVEHDRLRGLYVRLECGAARVPLFVVLVRAVPFRIVRTMRLGIAEVMGISVRFSVGRVFMVQCARPICSRGRARHNLTNASSLHAETAVNQTAMQPPATMRRPSGSFGWRRLMRSLHYMGVVRRPSRGFGVRLYVYCCRLHHKL